MGCGDALLVAQRNLAGTDYFGGMYAIEQRVPIRSAKIPIL